jgi:hypothetical protein
MIESDTLRSTQQAHIVLTVVIADKENSIEDGPISFLAFSIFSLFACQETGEIYQGSGVIYSIIFIYILNCDQID